MTVRRLLLLAAALLAASLVAPAAAPAKPVKWVTYSATLEATGDYAALDSTPTDILYEARWKWTTTFPSIVFEGDRAHTTGDANAPTNTSGYLVRAYGSRDLGSEVAVCESTSLWGPPSPGRFLEAPYTPNADPVLRLRMLTGAGPDFRDCPKQAAAQFSLQGHLVEGVHTYDTAFTFPREAIGMGKVIQVVKEQVKGRRCPNNLHDGIPACTLDIDATITFEKTGEWVADDGTAADPPPAPPAPPARQDPPPVIEPHDIPMPPKGGAEAGPPAAEELELLIPDPPKLGRGTRSAKVPVTCATACSGTVTATALGRRAAARSAARRVLARSRFTAEAGRTATVRLRFGRAARRAIRRAGGVRLTVAAAAPGRPPVRRTRTVRTRR